MSMKKVMLMTGVLATMAALSLPAHADDSAYQGFQAGDILVRMRSGFVFPETSTQSSTIGGKVSASDSVIPELDGTYFFTKNIAVEAIAATTRHNIKLAGSSADPTGKLDLGHVSLLPPSITAQYHFLPTSTVNPYVGAGMNYTLFFGEKKGAAGLPVRYDNSFGEVLQAGADFHLTGNWYANVDVKQIFLSTVANVNHSQILADVNLNPTIAGVGVGYKF